MGVDIQSYPVRIGTNIFAHGTDVVLLQCCVIISAGLNAVGAITFIVMLLLMAGIEPNPGPPKKDWQAHSDKDSTKSPLEAHFVRFRAINRSRKLQENMRPQCRLTRNSIEVSTNEVEDLQAQSDEDSANNPPLGAHFVRLRATDMQPQRSVIKSSEEVSTNEVEAQQKKTNVSVKPKSLSTMDDPKTSKKVSEIPAMTTQEPKPNVSVNQQSSCSIIYANPNITESQVPVLFTGKKMERRSQASPLDQHNPDVSMQKVSVPKAPPVRQPRAYQLYAARVYKKESAVQGSNGPAMGDMAESAAVTADIAGTEEVVSQRSTDTTKHQSEQTALVVIPSDVTVYKGSPTKAMSDMTESTDVTGAIADTKEVASQRRIGTPNYQSEHTALDVIPPDVTKYKGARTKRSDGPAMGDMAESAAVTADIAGTEEVVSQRSTDTTKHQSEQTALVVIPSDVTVYKGSPTKDSDGPAMSDMTESTDVTGAIADTKEVASQRRIGTPKHQSEHTALDVIPPDVTKYKGARTKITTSPPTKPNVAVKPKSLSTMGDHEDSKKVSEIPAMTQQPKPNVPVNQQSPCSIIDANTNITESQVPGLGATDMQQPQHSVTSSSKEVSSDDVESKGLRATDMQQPQNSVTSSSNEDSSNDVESKGLRATDMQQPQHSVTSSSKEVSSDDVEVPKAPPVGQPRAYQLYAPRVYKKESGVQGSNGPAMGDMAGSAAVTADIAGTEEVVSQRSTDTTKHQSEQTALVDIPSDVTVYKGSPIKDSDGPAMSDMTESTDVTGGIADTKDVASQRRICTPKHQSEQTAPVVILSDVTVYKGSPIKDSDGPAMSDMTESTDVTGAIADTKEEASQRRFGTPKHQSEHTALDVIPPDVTKYKGARTKRAETSSHDVAENLSASDAHTQLSKRKYLGTHPVHISNLVGPDWKVSTRAVDHGHVQDLQSPFQGSFHGQLVVLYGIVQKRMLGKVEEPGSCQIQTIGGNHTRIALQELRSKGVETPSLVQCHLYCDTIPRENALVLGLHHDMVHEELSKPLSFLDKAKIMRDVRPEDRDSKKWKRRIGLIFKEDVMGKFSLYMAVASLEDSLWELAVRVEDKLSTPIVKTMMEVLPDRKRDALEALKKGMNNFKSLIASVKSEEGQEKSNKRKAENDVEVLQEEVSVSAVESSPSLELQELRKRYDDLKEAFNRLKEEQSMKEDFSDGEEVSVKRVEDGQTILYDAVIIKKEYYIKYVADNQRGRVGQASLKKK
ncbi:uncharacterized protein LOC128229814 isoform X1 [Mya arenaria]|uniref:uncharacterized protein LOC128229814 isoform X1 n=1 Tax=Mya arenaria TaxID=6604 RepID=UPI0022DEB459|nr:uncharacterized protein LOC128229814 isoform X1 [Mya arenaria]